jgi:ribosomal protein S18 acetylase RimI-like enzyme
MSGTEMTGTMEIRDASPEDAAAIHEVLSQAFMPYKKYYTGEAYNITVCSLDEIRNRINSTAFDMLVAVAEERIVGTAALLQKEPGILYLGSMAVTPDMQGRSIGYVLLEEVEHRAREKGCMTISLECYEPLKMAIGLYQRMGYTRTGRSRPYYGIEVFEMQKKLN